VTDLAVNGLPFGFGRIIPHLPSPQGSRVVPNIFSRIFRRVVQFFPQVL